MSVNPSLPHSIDKLGERAEIVREYEYSIRVRYHETDAQGRVHHATYANYLELARVEMLRASGVRYRDLETVGINLVVTRLVINFLQGAKFDDLLTIKTTIVKAKGVRIQHQYEISLDDQLLAKAETTVAAIDRTGKVHRLPNWLRLE